LTPFNEFPLCVVIVAQCLPDPCGPSVSSDRLGFSAFDFERPPGGFEELWCYCNTLKIFTQRHTAGRIAWSHDRRNQRLGGSS
jgi:hypothetical protein